VGAKVDAKAIVEIGCIVVMVSAPILSVIFAIKQNRPFLGEGVIRFLAIAEIIPAVVILGIEQVLDKGATGTVLAGIAGYVLGGMTEKASSPNQPDAASTPSTDAKPGG
jgi:hypothetical protein